MPITAKGVIEEVNKQLSEYRVRGVAGQIDLKGNDLYRADYTGRILSSTAQDPLMRGVRTGLSIFNFMSAYAAVYAQVDARPRYKLATQDPQKIDTYYLKMPDHVPQTSKSIRFTPGDIVNILANHGLWLASQDVTKRRDIPDALEKRLAASASNPSEHLRYAVSEAVKVGANIAASVDTFEKQNGIDNRGSNVAGYAIYGYCGGDYDRLSNTMDVTAIG